jgi:ABC-type nickel/cobalt efflux system permease component RcnA
MNDKKSPMQRRLRFSLLVLISQILLVALAISWLVHMVTIAVCGSAYFVENNRLILWSEIALTILITMYALYILIGQIQRLGERRGDERNRRADDQNRRGNS